MNVELLFHSTVDITSSHEPSQQCTPELTYTVQSHSLSALWIWTDFRHRRRKWDLKEDSESSSDSEDECSIVL